MQKSNLVRYLKQFSKQDWRSFRKFVRSPYFNQREDVVQLFDYLDSSMATLKPKLLDRDLVFKQVFPNEKLDEIKLRHTTGFLLKTIKKYLAQIEFENDGIQYQQYFCKSLRKKRMGTFFEKEILKSQKLLESQTYRDGSFYLKKYQLEMEQATFVMPQDRSGGMNFQNNVHQLSLFYISSMLRLSCNIQSHQAMSRQAYDLKLLTDIFNIATTKPFIKEPSVSLYFHCYKASEYLQSNDFEISEGHFQTLKNLLNDNWPLFPQAEIRDIYLFAINYCIKRLNAGDKKFIREAFELFRSGLKNETLLEEGALSSFTFKNITRLGMALSEIDWVEDFLKNYKRYLRPRERDNTWRYNLAFFYFHQQKHQQAMSLLLEVEFKDVLNNLDARRMLLKSYFELGEYNALESLLDSFYQYIQRQKNMGYHRENYLNLIRFVRKLVHGGTRDKGFLKELEEEIKATTRMAEREWLLAKIDKFDLHGFE